jgi:alpha-ketoglutarate-dependent 2,4-dichlorophenoxyacetate dioxygenase
MAISIQPIAPNSSPDFAGQVEGIDLCRALDRDEIAAVEAGMDRFAVLVFRNQHLDDDTQLLFSRGFGTLERDTGDLRQGVNRRLPMELVDISNLDPNNRMFARDDRRRLFTLGNQLWHSDSSFKPVPSKYSLLSARVITSKGGNTEFADMRAAYDTLDPELKALVEDCICEHCQVHSRGLLGWTEFTDEERANNPPVLQRLVRSHPVTGRRSLFLSAHAGAIVGWPVPEARALLRELTEHATQPRFVYSHSWTPWDLVMWDNRVTMHRGRRYPIDEVRDLHRTTIAGDGLTLEQAV